VSTGKEITVELLKGVTRAPKLFFAEPQSPYPRCLSLAEFSAAVTKSRDEAKKERAPLTYVVGGAVSAEKILSELRGCRRHQFELGLKF